MCIREPLEGRPSSLLVFHCLVKTTEDAEVISHGLGAGGDPGEPPSAAALFCTRGNEGPHAVGQETDRSKVLSPELPSHLQKALVSSPFLSWLTSFIQKCLHIKDLGRTVVGGQLSRQS